MQSESFVSNILTGSICCDDSVLFLPPNTLALVNYKAVGEIIRLSNIQTKQPFYLRPKFVTWFFFASDVLSLFCQGAGGGLQATGTTPDAGKAITLVGLSAQLVFFTCFVYITIHVHRHPEYTYCVEGQKDLKKHLILCLDITLVLLYIRSIYRAAEYSTGYGGPIARLEWAFYVFDTFVIVVVSWHTRFTLLVIIYLGVVRFILAIKQEYPLSMKKQLLLHL